MRLQNTCRVEGLNNMIARKGRAKGQPLSPSTYGAMTDMGVLHGNAMPFYNAIKKYPLRFPYRDLEDPRSWAWQLRVMAKMGLTITEQYVQTIVDDMRRSVAQSDLRSKVQMKIKRAGQRARRKRKAAQRTEKEKRRGIAQYGDSTAGDTDATAVDSEAPNSRPYKPARGHAVALPDSYKLLVLHVQTQGFDVVCDRVTQLGVVVVDVKDGAVVHSDADEVFASYCCSLPVNRDTTSNSCVTDDVLAAACSEKDALTAMLSFVQRHVGVDDAADAMIMEGVLAQPSQDGAGVPCVLAARHSSTHALAALHRLCARTGVDSTRVFNEDCVNIVGCVQLASVPLWDTDSDSSDGDRNDDVDGDEESEVEADDTSSPPDAGDEVGVSGARRHVSSTSFALLHAAVARRIEMPVAAASAVPQRQDTAAGSAAEVCAETRCRDGISTRSLTRALATARSWSAVMKDADQATKQHILAFGGLHADDHPRCAHGKMLHAEAPTARTARTTAAAEGACGEDPLPAAYSVRFTCCTNVGARCEPILLDVAAGWSPQVKRQGKMKSTAREPAAPNASKKRQRNGQAVTAVAGACSCTGKCATRACVCRASMVACTGQCHGSFARASTCVNCDGGRGGSSSAAAAATASWRFMGDERESDVDAFLGEEQETSDDEGGVRSPWASPVRKRVARRAPRSRAGCRKQVMFQDQEEEDDDGDDDERDDEKYELELALRASQSTGTWRDRSARASSREHQQRKDTATEGSE
jgi:hypothetical protein